MFKKCPGCAVGKKLYSLDKNSPFCPYLYSHNGKSCPFYIPIQRKQKTGLLNDFFKKRHS